MSAPKLGRWLTNGKREPISTRGHQSSVSSESTSLQVIGATAQRSPGSWFVALGEEKLASREVNYARARGGNNLRTGKLSRASLANANPRPAGTFRHSWLRQEFLSLPFSIESGGFGLVKAG